MLSRRNQLRSRRTTQTLHAQHSPAVMTEVLRAKMHTTTITRPAIIRTKMVLHMGMLFEVELLQVLVCLRFIIQAPFLRFRPLHHYQ